MKNLKATVSKLTKGERRNWPKIGSVPPTKLDSKLLECKKVTPNEISIRSKGIRITYSS